MGSRSNSYERKDEQISGQTSPHLVLPPPPCKHTGNRRSSVDRSNGSRSKLEQARTTSVGSTAQMAAGAEMLEQDSKQASSSSVRSISGNLNLGLFFTTTLLAANHIL